jgi:hypothetical protein
LLQPAQFEDLGWRTFWPAARLLRRGGPLFGIDIQRRIRIDGELGNGGRGLATEILDRDRILGDRGTG